MKLLQPDKIQFACSYCECRFAVEVARAAAEQEIVCPNCQRRFDQAMTRKIGRAARELFSFEPAGFSWWLE